MERKYFSPCPHCDGRDNDCAGCEVQALRASGLTPDDLPRAAALLRAESPYPDGDTSILSCPHCGSGEYLSNEDGAQNAFCGQCGQKIDWSTEAEAALEDKQ